MQLQYAATHQCMRRDGVRAITPAIDDQNPHPLACHQHSCCRPCAARTDDESIIGFVSEHVALPL